MKNKKQFDLKGYKPPYLMWYERDFRAKTMQLTWLQRLLYRALLQSMFCCETRPYLPNDDKQLWQLADAQDIKTWKKHKPAIIEFFKPVKGSKRLLQNSRMNEELLKATAKARTGHKAGIESQRKSREAAKNLREAALITNPNTGNGNAENDPNSKVNTRSTDAQRTSTIQMQKQSQNQSQMPESKEASAAAASLASAPATASPLTGASGNLASATTASAAAAAAPSTPAPLPAGQTGKDKLEVLKSLAAKTNWKDPEP